MSKKLNFGEFCWNELMTPDTKKAQAFYQDLFGWTSTKHDMGESTYTMFMQGDKTIGGMLKTPEDNANIPPHWMSYISVADLDATLDKVKKLGGTVIVPKTTAGDMGSFAIIQDPTGAHIAIWKPSQEAI